MLRIWIETLTDTLSYDSDGRTAARSSAVKALGDLMRLSTREKAGMWALSDYLGLIHFIRGTSGPRPDSIQRSHPVNDHGSFWHEGSVPTTWKARNKQVKHCYRPTYSRVFMKKKNDYHDAMMLGSHPVQGVVPPRSSQLRSLHGGNVLEVLNPIRAFVQDHFYSL